jgi:predicted metal-dependent hydrolase
MTRHVLPGDPPVAVALRRSARARRLSLRVSGADGRVTLTLPRRVTLREGLAFLREREAWVRERIGRVQAFAPRFGTTIPFEGRPLLLSAGPRVAIHEDRLEMPGDESALPRRLLVVLREAARERLSTACALHAGRLGRSHGRISLRDARSRWGSCSARGDLMFSWRLVLAPPAVLDYVAAHEVAHLARMDHSPAFWAVVEGLCPGYAGPRAWLRENGAGLHRLRLQPRAASD